MTEGSQQRPGEQDAEEKVFPIGNHPACDAEQTDMSHCKVEWKMADKMLRAHDISPVRVACMVLDALETTESCHVAGESAKLRLGKIIRLGCENYAASICSVNFRELVESVLRYKSYRRERTVGEIMQYSRRMMRQDPSWSSRIVRSISSDDCRELITKTFPTLPMRRKARVILHGIFSYALRRGWCSGNPIDAIDLPPAKEKRITVLSLRQVQQLLMTSLQNQHFPCAPAVGLLLWGGVRPSELERLQWKNIRFEDKVITIPPSHSKTGGARQVTLYPPLYNWLRKTSFYRLPDAYIIPATWRQRWLNLRRDAGFVNWESDILRHTFASYHLKYFRNLRELQIDMGHGSTDLLRTRYISMDNVTKSSAHEFWHLSVSKLLLLMEKGTSPLLP